MHDALGVIKELKADRDQLRKDLAQARQNRKALPPRGTPARDIGGETINALLSNTVWAVQKPKINTGHATAQVGEPAAEQESPSVDMLAPEQVFTPEDKEDER